MRARRTRNVAVRGIIEKLSITALTIIMVVSLSPLSSLADTSPQASSGTDASTQAQDGMISQAGQSAVLDTADVPILSTNTAAADAATPTDPTSNATASETDSAATGADAADDSQGASDQEDAVADATSPTDAASTLASTVIQSGAAESAKAQSDESTVLTPQGLPYYTVNYYTVDQDGSNKQWQAKEIGYGSSGYYVPCDKFAKMHEFPGYTYDYLRTTYSSYHMGFTDVPVTTDPMMGPKVQNDYPGDLTVNLFYVAPATLDVSKTLDGTAPASGAYSFKVTRTSAPDGAPAFEEHTATNDATGAVDFGAIPYTVAGTYVYEVTETTGSSSTVISDTRTYTVTQEVAVLQSAWGPTDALGVMSTTYAPSKATDAAGSASSTTAAAFANYTKPTASLSLTKTVSTAGLASYPTFSYTLTAGTNTAGVTTPMPASATGTTAKTTTTGAGTASFGDIAYEAVGTYNYTVTEDDVTAAGWTKDSASYGWTVTVTQVNGKLVATGTLTKDGAAASAVTFNNTYASTGSLSLTASKTLEGATLTAGQFSFQLLDADGNVLQTKANAADGSVAFDAIPYTQDDIESGGKGTKTYTIHEVVPDQPAAGYTYDSDDVTVSVALTDDGAGKITAVPTYEKAGKTVDAATFTNTYSTTTQVEAVKTGTTQQVKAGDDVEWNITMTNTSQTTVYGTWVKDVAPAYTTLTSCGGGSSSAVKTAGGVQYATWFIERMDPGESVTLTLSGTVNNDVPENYMIVNIANYEVTGSTTPPDDTKTPTGNTNEVDTPTPSVSSTTATAQSSALPKTGDGSAMPFCLAIVAVSVGCACIIALRRRRRDEK